MGFNTDFYVDHASATLSKAFWTSLYDPQNLQNRALAYTRVKFSKVPSSKYTDIYAGIAKILLVFMSMVAFQKTLKTSSANFLNSP